MRREIQVRNQDLLRDIIGQQIFAKRFLGRSSPVDMIYLVHIIGTVGRHLLTVESQQLISFDPTVGQAPFRGF